MKRIIFISVISLFACQLQAQRTDVQNKYFATSEKEMYNLIEQMIDSIIQVKKEIAKRDYRREDDFSTSLDFYNSIKNQDTIVLFLQDCKYRIDGYICENYYQPYLSDCMPIDFYERLLNYLEKIRESENYYKKKCSFAPLYSIRKILIKQYESGKLNKKDSTKALELIEKISLININEKSYSFILWDFDKYMTDKIRQALVNAIENPFYSSALLESYMALRDTAYIDTTGIPNEVKIFYDKYEYCPKIEDCEYVRRLEKFYNYASKGKHIYNGISAGQAYLKEKEKECHCSGYSYIDTIAEYAYKKQDKLLIEHLKEFKKKHPDYPLKYF